MNGRLMLTQGVSAKGTLVVHRCLLALAHYDGWKKNNDPHGEADMCTFDVDGLKVCAKLELYEKHDQNFGSEDPAEHRTRHAPQKKRRPHEAWPPLN